MKKNIWVYVVSAVFIIIIIVSVLAVLDQVRDIKNLVSNGSVSIGNQPYVVDNGDEAEAPSIFCDSGLTFSGADTVSVKNKTIECKVSLTPSEFKEGTKGRVKVKGKNYVLKRQDNCFTGTFPVPLFESVDPEVILEDGETVRTEYPFFTEAAVPTDFTWQTTGNSPQIGKNEAEFDVQIGFSPGESTGTPSSAQIIGMIDGKEVYDKTFNMELQFGEMEEDGFLWQDTVPFEQGKQLEIYLVTKAKFGLSYYYRVGIVGQNADFFDQEKEIVQVRSSDGNVLFTKKAYEYEEEL